MMGKIRIVLVEEQPLILEGIKGVLRDNKDIALVGFSNGSDAVDVVRELQPDVVVLDVYFLNCSGLDLCALFLDVSVTSKIIFFTMHQQISIVVKALAGGALGYVLKSSPVDYLLLAIQQVSQGFYFLSPGINDTILKYFVNTGFHEFNKEVFQTDIKGLVVNLSPREVQILKFIVNGSTTKEIANLLCVSTKTIDKHRSAIYKKTKVRTPFALTRFAFQNNIVPLEAWLSHEITECYG